MASIMNIDWKKIQQSLARLGHYTGSVDGIRGPLTDAAIVAFKRSAGLRARPYVGPLTLAALETFSKNNVYYMDTARALLGVHEARDYSRLKKWLAKTVAWIDPREVPWCGAFVETVLRSSGFTETVSNPLGARQWLTFGQAVEPQRGAIMVFWRGSESGWQGHVGFYWGEDKTHYHVLGGNQSNAVTISRIAKTRLLGARLPNDFIPTGRKVLFSSNGVPVTANEV